MARSGRAGEAPDPSRRALLRGTAFGAAVLGASELLARGVAEAEDGKAVGRGALPGPSSAAVATDVVFRTSASRPVVALTVDDGPSRTWTPQFLELLRRHGVSATFFLVGERAVRNPDLVTHEVAAGHEIGNHTWTHIDLTHHTSAVVGEQLRRTDTLLTSLTGRSPTLVRPPWGHIDVPGLLSAADLRCRTVLWSHLIRGSHAESDVDKTLASITPGSIVLTHDGGPTPTRSLLVALERFIMTMQARGYEFATVGGLLGGG